MVKRNPTSGEMNLFPTFETVAEWVSYREFLADRLKVMLNFFEENTTPLPVNNRDSLHEKLTPLQYLQLLGKWMDAYGVDLQWLFAGDNQSLEIMQKERRLKPGEMAEFILISTRFLKALDTLDLSGFPDFRE